MPQRNAGGRCGGRKVHYGRINQSRSVEVTRADRKRQKSDEGSTTGDVHRDRRSAHPTTSRREEGGMSDLCIAVMQDEEDPFAAKTENAPAASGYRLELPVLAGDTTIEAERRAGTCVGRRSRGFKPRRNGWRQLQGDR